MSEEDLKEAAQNMGGAAGQSGDDVVDADYEEVDTDEESANQENEE
ncbi:hypothetical protein HRED_07459 [Candidatus Haloredivivus sp. G17]|nr:hypothetical protein HRED_09227 [Candidatus Haloredivivus sp. G17]EHK01695.1 hypothetical protein HRED_07459 [Candidatus Haloredivivus sp. G17]